MEEVAIPAGQIETPHWRALSRYLNRHTRDYLAVFDAQGRLSWANYRLARSLGKKAEDLVGCEIALLGLPAELAEQWQSMLDLALQSRQRQSFEYSPDDGRRLLRSSFLPLVDGERTPAEILTITRDISPARRISDGLRDQALQDPLTGLINRRGFEQELKRLIDDAKEFGHHHALCFLDLDDFKLVNDSCGHSAGDALLRQLPQLLRPLVREHDTIARLGGDEFGVLLSGCDLLDAGRIAEKLRDAVRAFRFSWQSRNFSVGASIGVVGIAKSSEGLESVMRQADTACYAAKDQGRNSVHVSHPHDLAVIRRRGELRWADRLRTALQESRGFCLHYQSIKSLAADQLDAAPRRHELLLRLNDADDQPILPGAFLPAAERHGLMSQIDNWVITNGFAEIGALLRNEAAGHRFGINLAASSLADPGLVETIRHTLRANGISPDSVFFEIRETAASLNLGTTLNFMRALRDMGCGLVLDDFGSGAASFSYLKSLPVDLIKIDGSIISELVGSPVDEAIVRGINDVAHRMGIDTVAESVESEALVTLLGEIGLDYAQGYHYGKPKPLREFSAPVATTPIEARTRWGLRQRKNPH